MHIDEINKHLLTFSVLKYFTLNCLKKLRVHSNLFSKKGAQSWLPKLMSRPLSIPLQPEVSSELKLISFCSACCLLTKVPVGPFTGGSVHSDLDSGQNCSSVKSMTKLTWDPEFRPMKSSFGYISEMSPLVLKECVVCYCFQSLERKHLVVLVIIW